MYKDINVTENGTFNRITDITLVPGDSNAYRICYKTLYDLENVEFKITAIRSDGKIINDIGECEGKTAYCILSNSVYAIPGDLTLRLSLITEDTVLTQKELIMMVAEDYSSSGESATNEVSFADKLIQRMQNLLSAFYEKVSLLIPTKTSELTNDSGFLTEHQDISGKADKEQSGGGFIGGRNAKVGDNNDNPGAALGSDALAGWGFAGGAVSKTNGGAACGYYTTSRDGAAVGKGAETSEGVAVGSEAKTKNANGEIIDAVQLGTGVNNEEKSMQVYNYKLLSSNGVIPTERTYTIVSDTSTTMGDVTVTLEDKKEYRFGIHGLNNCNMNLLFPGIITNSYMSCLVFDSGRNLATMGASWTLVYTEDIYWSGDDIFDDVFVPQPSKIYNVVFWYDGFNLNGAVRGVAK